MYAIESTDESRPLTGRYNCCPRARCLVVSPLNLFRMVLFFGACLLFGISAFFGGKAMTRVKVGKYLLGSYFAIFDGLTNGYQVAELPILNNRALNNPCYYISLLFLMFFMTPFALYLANVNGELFERDSIGNILLVNTSTLTVSYFMADGLIRNSIKCYKALTAPRDPGDQHPLLNSRKIGGLALDFFIAALGGLSLTQDNIAAQKQHNNYLVWVMRKMGLSFLFEFWTNLVITTLMSGFGYYHLATDNRRLLLDRSRHGPATVPNILSLAFGISEVAASAAAVLYGTIKSSKPTDIKILFIATGFIASFFANFDSARSVAAESMVRLLGVSEEAHFPFLQQKRRAIERVAEAAAIELAEETSSPTVEVEDGHEKNEVSVA